MILTTRHPPQAALSPPSATPADGAARSISPLQNPVSTGFFTSNRPLPGVFPAQAAIELGVNEVSPSAAARRSFTSCAVSPRSNLVAHSHALTRTASACRVSVTSHADAHAARPESSITSSHHYQLHSTPRTFHVGYRPISLINSSPNSYLEVSSTSNFKPFEPLTLTEPAQSATEFVVSDITAQAVSQTSNSRAQALGAASAGLYLYNNAKDIGKAAGNLADGKFSEAASISISLGSSKSQTNSESTSSTSQGSTLAAGGNIALQATGGGKVELPRFGGHLIVMKQGVQDAQELQPQAAVSG